MKKENFLIVIVSVLLATYTVEILLHLIEDIAHSPNAPQLDLAYSKAQEQNPNADKRTIHEIIKDENLAGRQTVLYLPPFQRLSMSANIFPLGGLPDSRNLYCNEIGEPGFFHSDRNGFRNPDEITDDLDIELMIVGDSFGLGFCVDTDIGARLRRSGIKTINFSSSGSGPLMKLATLREYGEAFHPKHIFWIYYEGNDLTDLIREQESDLLMSYLNNSFSQSLLTQTESIQDAFETYYEALSKRPNKGMLQFVVADITPKANKAADASRWEQAIRLSNIRELLEKVKERQHERRKIAESLVFFEAVLAHAKRHAGSFGAKLHFVYLPEWQRYAKPNQSFSLWKQRVPVVSIAESLDIPVIDFTEIFTESGDPLSFFPYRGNAHYTQEGYNLVSDNLVDYLSTIE